MLKTSSKYMLYYKTVIE